MKYEARYGERVATVTPLETSTLVGLREWLWRVHVDDEIVTDAEGHNLFVEVEEAKRAAEDKVGVKLDWKEEK